MSNESSKDPESTRTQGPVKEDSGTATRGSPAPTSPWSPSRGDSPAREPFSKNPEGQKPGQPATGRGENAKGAGTRTGAQRGEGGREEIADPEVDPVTLGPGGRSEGNDSNRSKQSGDQPARPNQK